MWPFNNFVRKERLDRLVDLVSDLENEHKELKSLCSTFGIRKACYNCKHEEFCPINGKMRIVERQHRSIFDGSIQKYPAMANWCEGEYWALKIPTKPLFWEVE